ncbi:hypothetical protein BRC67_07555 [Halobacteriales archaeon QH_3_68_24]|nr:MAG: hypothetical protein BRC60_07785 [Halobacteriales archaeon QH_1_68_42]PSP51468.1 MAG: hypothetical protein BRC67_07555 [Halobacteriales archaeon QH_3_68_24]PSP71477.1 MAG: hypothetical protein BRC70_04710 [Halobacteriales archaeon QH_6_68_27]
MRVLFTVALAVAVLAVASPAVDAVGVERADTRTGAAVDRLVEAGRALAAGNDALRPDHGPARRVLELDLPVGGVASAPLRSLTVGPPESTGERGVDARPTNAATRVAWRVQGGTERVRQVAGLRLRPVEGERFELGRGGRQRLVLRLVERDGRRVVTVAAGLPN